MSTTQWSITYYGSFRDGYVILTRGDIKIRFDHEMGSGNCVAFFHIPTQEEWQAKTGTGPEDRDEILKALGDAIIRDQLGSCGYTIEHNTIVFKSRGYFEKYFL